jgi:hypothetical protein
MKIPMLAAALAAMLAAAPAAAAPAAEAPGTLYLLSIGRPDLRRDERVVGFSLASWGVDWLAICTIPSGWRLRAGRNATPEGLFEGEGTHGATWLDDLGPLRSVALVRLWGPVQWRDKPVGNGKIPATLAGTLETSEGRRVRLGPSTLRLTPAPACPAPAR